MSRYKPYGAYKDSGKAWLGRIPEHWTLAAFKRVASICNGKDYKDVENPEGIYPVIGSGGEFARADSFLFEGESVLLGRKGTIDKPLYINGPFWAVDTMFYTKIADDAFPKFVYYAALNIPFGLHQTNTALPSMAGEDLSSHVICVPQYDEQREIADKLDRELARIDTLVEKKTIFVDLLKQKRLSLIAQAVTKGLDPNVKMQDSGVEWLGKIPAHWKTMPAKRLICEYDVRSQTGEEELLTVSHITGVTPRSQKNVNMFEAESTVGYKLCRPGDLAINTLWAWMGAMGVAPVAGIVSPAYHVYELGPLLRPGYIDAMSRMPLLAQEVTRFSKGICSSRLRLYPEDFFEVEFPVPPLAEQDEIIKTIARQSKQINALLDKTEESILLLNERRMSFIISAVTGQIDLREAIA